MRKTTFLIASLLAVFISNAQLDFDPIIGPVNVAAGSPVTLNINDIANSAGATASSTGTYNAFSVSVTWENGSGVPWSNEADLTITTTAGSVTIDPPTTGGAGSTASTTLTFDGDLAGLYDPISDGYLDIVLNQSYNGSNANWSNIVVTLFETPTCPNPINLDVLNATETSVDLSWTETGTAMLWNVEYGTAGFTPGTGTLITDIASTIYTLAGLQQGVIYEFYVQSNCGGGDTSDYIGPFGFGTLVPGGTCATASNMTVVSDCSTTTPTTFNFAVSADIDANNENPTCDALGNYGYFITFTAPTIGSVYFNFTGGADNIGLEVLDACGGNSLACFNNTFDSGDSSDLIGGLTPGATYYAVLWRDQQSGSAEICIEEGDSCPGPSNLDATGIGFDSATLSWTESGIATSWNLEWGASGFSLGSGTAVNNLTNPSYSLSGLSSSTSYDFYVQSNCTGETSSYSGPFTFTTPAPSRINFTQQSITLNTSGSYATAIVDMDGDFLDDIVGVQANSINIKQQNIDGSFTDVNISTPNADYTPSWSIAAADYDANGKTDLLYGAGSGVTFMRASADGLSFTEQSTTEYVFSQRSNFIDINNDGNLDAFVCHDVQPNVYFINDGTGVFDFYQSDVTPGAPYSLGNFSSGGDYGSIWIDYNNDRNMDLFVSKCGGSEARRTNIMLTNNGDDTYSENAAAIGLADPMQTWSSAWGDFDNDGDMDVFVGASSGNHKLMENTGFSDDGDPTNDYVFTDVTSGAGVSSAPTGWESSAFDIDNDGYLDIISNGTILYGKGDMTFEDADPNQIDYKNGSFGDLNNDGFIDTYYNQSIYYNQGNSNNWIKINTIGMAHVTPNYSNINGIGARVELTTNAGTQIRDVRSGEGFEFMSSLTTHFGIGTETSISELRIYWPSGVIDVVPNPTINTTHNIVEGTFPLSLEDQSLTDISIFPNPAKDILTISTVVDLNQRIATVFDVTGKKVLNQRLMTNQVDVSTLQNGVYFLRIENEGRSITRKFIKE
ncbi:MAG: VCBS repeat-containing protein [Winogradskyella sp.]|uniref:FG-GAP-like repeat-containing protein n=1 Tax=Winogradskyella sp. TaxID=1883156 RepID=UPI0025FC07D5|nr:FG-GAP-like repeat-containing protein [Winogradskyella sp.]NRB59651.1 VCBS repeat-containing protein [Winogradskyella sp.]